MDTTLIEQSYWDTLQKYSNRAVKCCITISPSQQKHTLFTPELLIQKQKLLYTVFKEWIFKMSGEKFFIGQ